jgi:hypothetical protein
MRYGRSMEKQMLYVPRARERVQIIGRSGVFSVVRVDEELQAADLFPLHFAIFVEEGVPFSDLEPYRANLPLDNRASPGHGG